MTNSFGEILANLQDKAPRSRLEPYRELIMELRARKRTFQEIAAILGEKVDVHVTASGVHDYCRRRGAGKNRAAGSNQNAREASLGTTAPQRRLTDESRTLRDIPGKFDFDPTDPLRLKEPAKRPSRK